MDPIQNSVCENSVTGGSELRGTTVIELHEYVSFMLKKRLKYIKKGVKYIYSFRHYYIFETRHQTARHPLMTMKLERKGLETVQENISYIINH